MKNKLLQKKILDVNNALIEYYGIPERNLKLPKPIDMLIATILSQNTNDKNSHRAWLNLKTKYNSWHLLLNISIKQLQNDIRVAGLTKQKALAIKGVIKKNYTEGGSKSMVQIKNMSNTEALSYLTNFDGVGVKTASCVLLFSLNRNVCPVDTHVHRISNRIGLVETNTPDKTFAQLNEKFPKEIAHSFHTNLIKLGREFCKSTNPACKECPIENQCGFNGKNFQNKKFRVNNFMLLDNVK
jgi:endonuclease-3